MLRRLSGSVMIQLLLATHNSPDALAMVAADVSRKFGQQFTNALKVSCNMFHSSTVREHAEDMW